MAPTPYPLPESTRQSAVLLGDGSTTYGPFGDGWGIFDIGDVLVETRAVGSEIFVEAAVTIAKVNPAAPYDFFTVTFGAALSSGFEFRVTGDRLHTRELAVTRGGAIDGVALEKELSKQSVVLQEQRRDINAAAAVVEGDAASAAVAAAATATAAAASSAASAAIFSTALAVLVGDAGGTPDELVLSHASFAGLVAYPDDMLLVFRHVAANTGAMTAAASPLAAKPFLDVNGAAFTGGEFSGGDISIALYNVTNNQIRCLRHIVDAVQLTTANIFEALQTFNAGLLAASQATFSKQVVYTPVTLVDAVSIAWDLNTGSNFEVTLGGNRTLAAFTGGSNGQKGTLRVIQDATGGRTLDLSNALYDFSGGLIEPISQGANEVTEYEWERISAGSVRLKRKWMSGRNSIGFWKEYDLGAPVAASVVTTAHLLGRQPADCQLWVEFTTAEHNYAIGDRILLGRHVVNSTSNGVTVYSNATVVGVVTGSGGLLCLSHNRTTGVSVSLTNANIKYILRIYE